MSFQPNQQIFTCTAVNLRAASGHLGDTPPTVPALLVERTACTVTGVAKLADGLTWWRVRFTQGDGSVLEGWAAQASSDALLLAAMQPLAASPGGRAAVLAG